MVDPTDRCSHSKPSNKPQKPVKCVIIIFVVVYFYYQNLSVKNDALFFSKSYIFSMWKIKYSVTLLQCKIRDKKIPSSPYEGLHLRHGEDHRRRRWRWNRRSSGVGVGRLRQKGWTPWLLNPFPSSFCQPPKHVRVNNGSSVCIDILITDRSHAAVSCTSCTTTIACCTLSLRVSIGDWFLLRL